MLTSEVLRKAKELIGTPEKWCQRRLHSDDGLAHCVLGALLLATNARGWVIPGFALPAFTALNNLMGHSIASWNNDPRRTHGEVMLAYAMAIEYEEAREQAGAPFAPTPAPVAEAVRP